MASTGGGDTVIIDSGSGYCKAGLGGDDEPKVVLPTVVGKPIKETTPGETYFGVEAQNRPSMRPLTRPVERGVITGWDDMEQIWHHIFSDQLKVAPEKHTVLLTEPLHNPRANQERMTQIMFERFRVPAMYVGLQPVLCLYGFGRTVGTVLDSGDGLTSIVPIYEGYALPEAIRKFEFAGKDLTNYLDASLDVALMNISPDLEIARDIKDKLCYVAEDFKAEMASFVTKSSDIEESYALPDGKTVVVGKERFQCPEVLFQPSLLDKDVKGIHQLLFESVTACEIDIRRALFSNIMLAGGTTMLPGLSSRLTAEVVKLAPSNNNIRVRAPPERKNSAWIGGSVFASTSEFANLCISKKEYEENGASIVSRKGFASTSIDC